MRERLFNSFVLLLGIVAAGATGLENVPESAQPFIAAAALVCGALYRIFSPSLLEGEGNE